MNKKGFTLIEVIVSIGLISIVMLLLFQLLLDIQYESNHTSYAKENQVNRATVIETVQKDLMNNTLASIPTITTNGDRKEITLTFQDFAKTIRVAEDRITYDSETWLLEHDMDHTYFDLNNITIDSSTTTDHCSYILNVDIDGDGGCDANCEIIQNGVISSELDKKNETYKSCPTYQLLKITIPVVVEGQDENILDDFEFFYINNIGKEIVNVSGVDTYTITYDANGGTNAPVRQINWQGSYMNLSNLIPTRTGYTFLGWSLTSDASSASYLPGEFFDKDTDTTLYAVWKVNTYTITYDANGGSGAPDSQSYVYDSAETFNLSNVIPTRSAYTFLGWDTSSTASKASYQPGQDWKKSNAFHTTLYAIWDANTYTITYDANGGTGAPESQSYVYNTVETLKLSDTIPKRDGYAFLGWSISPTVTGASYQPGQEWKKSNAFHTTLYAVWKANTYTITYDANGGSGIPENQTKTHEVNLTLSNLIPTRTGYTFLGWSTSSGATSATYSPGDIFTINADTTLYAVWNINTYTITYNANGGSGAPSSQKITHGEYVAISNVIPTRAGHTFLGWSTSASATNATYALSSSFTTTSNVTLYAVWNINAYTITYNANGGSGAPASQTKTHGVNLTLSSTKPTRTGYTFLGWSTSSSATSPTYSPGSIFTSNADTTLYAIWDANGYTITYHANGGSGAPASQTKTHGVNLTLSSTKPTRSGYTFLGWSTSSTATSATYSPGGTFTTNANTTLYAVWRAHTYTITYHANGGSGAPASQTKTHGVNLTLSSTRPTRTGYSFLGWSTSSAATSATYRPGGSFTTNANTTLYAVWADDIVPTVSAHISLEIVSWVMDVESLTTTEFITNATLDASASYDLGSGIDRYYFSIDGGQSWITSNTTGIYTFTNLSVLNKIYPLTVRAYDKAGNSFTYTINYVNMPQ